MTVDSIARTLGNLSLRWLDKNFPYRKKAIRRLVRESHFSVEMAKAMLDALFKELTYPKLMQLLKSEFRDPRVLDEFRKDPVSGRWVRAQGPKRITHIFSGNVPNPSTVSFVLGMLVKSINVGKVSSEDEGFLDIYLESLRRYAKKLAIANFLLKPSDKKSTIASIRQSDLVVAYGNNETLNELRKEIPAAAHFVGYGHRVSFGLYTQEVLKKKNVEKLAEKTARDLWMVDQRGCLSPLTIFLEEKGETAPLDFAEVLAKNLQRFFSTRSPAPATYVRAVAHQTLINQCRMRQLKGEKISFWRSDPRGQWLVVYDKRASLLSGGNQVAYLKPFRKIREVLKALRPFEKHLQAVSLEAMGTRRVKIAGDLAKMGVNRICRAGQMQNPPLTWHHDGRPNLSEWVTWTDFEK